MSTTQEIIEAAVACVEAQRTYDEGAAGVDGDPTYVLYDELRATEKAYGRFHDALTDFVDERIRRHVEDFHPYEGG